MYDSFLKSVYADRRMAETERMDPLLELRDYTEELKLRGAKTMDELAERFQRGLPDLVQRGEAQVLHRRIERVRMA